MGFLLAKNLKANEKLLHSDGNEVIIEKLEGKALSKAETTYNLEVEDFHTYFVGERRGCVYIVGCGGDDSRTVAGPEDVGRYEDARN